MQRFIVPALLVVSIAWSPAWAAKGAGATGGGAAGVVQTWATAFQAKDTARLTSLLARDAGYSRLELVGNGKVKRWGAGSVTPELFWRPAEVQVVKVQPVSGSEVLGIVTQVVEEGSVRAWESWLTLRPGGANGWEIAQISDIAMEGSYPGDPEGCPETSAKRHEAVTLYGNLEAGRDFTVRIFQTRRDTDAWVFASNIAKAEDKEKKCSPRPGLSLEDLEVVVQEASGAMCGYQRFGRIDRTTGGGGRGIRLYTEAGGGPLVAGGARLYALPGGGLHLFLSRTWMSEKSQTDWRAVHRVDAYRWDGGAFHKVWGFDFGRGGGGLGGGHGYGVLWALSAPSPDGSIRADLAGGGSCSGTVNFTWAGSGFKMQKEGVTGGCLGSWWPGGEGSVLHMGEVNLERLAKKGAKNQTEDEE